MTDATCKTCPFHTEEERRWAEDTHYIICHFNAPYAGEGGPFPRVTWYDWCGEHPDRKPGCSDAEVQVMEDAL